MKVLYSTKQFKDKYVENTSTVVRGLTATTGCVAVAGGWMTAAGTAAASASGWSTVATAASWVPWFGPSVASWAAGKAAAVGLAAAFGASVLVPAILVGGGVAYMAYRKADGKREMAKTTPIETIADAFANVAFLPMAAKAIEVAQRNPGLANEMQDRVFNTAREWGYSDEYIWSLRDKYCAMSPDAIRRRYDENMAKIDKEGLRVFGCKR